MVKGKWKLIEYWDGQPMYEVAFWEDETDDVIDGWRDGECYISHYDDSKLGAEHFLWEMQQDNKNHIERGV